MTKSVDCHFSVEGSGPPLFLIHGIGAAKDAWRFIVPRYPNILVLLLMIFEVMESHL